MWANRDPWRFRPFVARLFIVCGLIVSGLSCEAPDVADPQYSTPMYLVDRYDPERDAAADLAAAVDTASAEQKLVLIQVGGDWCHWCHRLSQFWQETPVVRQALLSRFVVIKVNYSEDNKNEEFLKDFPAIDGFPHLFVVDADGACLHSQDTAALESGDSYDPRAMVDFLSTEF